MFVAGFASEDPGVQQSAQTLFKLDPSVVQAELGVETLNGEDVEQFSEQLPANVALFVEQCLATCNIKADPTPNQGGSYSTAPSSPTANWTGPHH